MKLSLFTVSFAGFWGQHSLTLEESIDQAAELGFAGVEIMGKRPHLSPLDYSIDDCKRLRERMEQRGIALSAIAAYTNFTGGTEAAEVPFVDFQVDYVGQLARCAQALGAIWCGFSLPTSATTCRSRPNGKRRCQPLGNALIVPPLMR